MSQQEVHKFLKKNKNKWFSTNQIKEKFKLKNTTNNLNRLYHYGEVFKKEISGSPGIKIIWRYRKN